MNSTLILYSWLFCVLFAAEPDIEAGKALDGTRIEGFAPFETSRLRSALQLAQARLTKKERCSKLFEELSQDGATLLAQARFERPKTLLGKKICRRNVAFFTTIGGRDIRVCESAFELERYTLASLLVHEALHLGGQAESPAVEGAPTSSELTRRVRKACSL